MKKTSYLVYFLLSLSVMGPLLAPGYVLTLDSPYAFIHDPTPLFFGLDEHWVSAAMPFYSLISGLTSFIPEWFVEKFILIIILFLSGLGAHRLFIWRGVGSYFSGILYMINPFTYIRFVTGQWDVLSAYALIPFAVKSFLDLVDNPNVTRAIKLAVLSTLVGIIEVQGLVLLSLIFVVMILVRSIFTRCSLMSTIKPLVISGIMFLAINLYWLVPTLTADSTIINEICYTDMFFFSPQANSSGRLLLDLASMHGFWRGGFIYLSNIFPAWWLLFGFLLFIAVYGFLSNFRDKDKGWLPIVFASLGIISFLIALGVSSGLTAPFFQWLWEHIVFFRGFRDSQKFIGLLCLSYAVLGGLGVREFSISFKKTKGVISRVLLIILIVVSLGFPFVYSLPMFGSHGQLGVVYPEDDWDLANEYLNSDSNDFNVLFLPWHLYMDFSWLPNKDKRLTYPAERFFDKPVIYSDNVEIPGVQSQSNNPISQYVEFLLSKRGQMENFGELLAPINVKYVVIVNEADYLEYDFLYTQNDLTEVFKKPGITIFQNQQYLSKVYSVDSIVYIESLEDYFALSQSQNVMEHLYLLENGINKITEGNEQQSSGKKVYFTEKSPVKYQLGQISYKYVIFTVNQNVNTNHWQYNGTESLQNLGFMPAFRTEKDKGEIIYSRFYRIYLPCYFASGLSIIVLLIMAIMRSKLVSLRITKY